MKLYLPILLIIISVLSCSKEGEQANDKLDETIAEEEFKLLDTSLNNEIDSLEIKENETVESEVDSLKLIEEQNRKINELMTYLSNPVEANYNYKWNDNVSNSFGSTYRDEFRKDPKVDSVLNLVSQKRKEILLSEFRYYLENPIGSNFKEYWKYYLYKTNDVVYDSLKLLAYYSGQKDFITKQDSTFFDFSDKQNYYADTLSISEIECFPKKNEDTLYIDVLSRCLNNYTPIKEFNRVNLHDIELYFQSEIDGDKVLGCDFDLIFIGSIGESVEKHVCMSIVLKRDNLDNVILRLSENIAYHSRGSFFNSKLTSKGELEVLVRTRRESGSGVSLKLIAEDDYLFFDVDHDVVLNYKLNDDLSLTFKGIRMVELKPLAIQTSW